MKNLKLFSCEYLVMNLPKEILPSDAAAHLRSISAELYAALAMQFSNLYR